MHIKHWKKIAFVVSATMHYCLWDNFAEFSLNEIQQISNSILTISATLIGFIFAIIAILVAISENPTVKKMRENGMYVQIIDHLGYLISGFSITISISYLCSLLSGDYVYYLLLIDSFVFTYSIIMMISDMFRRLKLTFRNLN